MTPLITTNRGIALPDGARAVIAELLAAASLPSCTVTSTARTPHDQARVMHENCRLYGVPSQMALYKEPGQAVIALYPDLVAMEWKINDEGPRNVSHHCTGPDSPIWVIDIDPKSLIRGNLYGAAKFVELAETHPRVSKVLKPPADPAIHLEILKIPIVG